ncbi:MAG: hypothetical protein DRH03_08030, partial [Deltaproteobacteria bacterium]
MKQISSLCITSLTLFILFFCLTGSQALAVTGIFPAQPAQGIKSVSYTISGTDLISQEEKSRDSGNWGIYYEGRLSSGTLRVQGTISANDDLDSASVNIRLQVGKPRTYSVLNLGRNEQENFDVSLPIPAMTPEVLSDIERYGAFIEIRVSMYCSPPIIGLGGVFIIRADLTAASTDSQNHAPTVSLNFSPAQPVVGSPINFTATAADADGDTLSYKWYLDGALQSGVTTTTVKWSQPSVGVHALKVVVSDGKGGEAEDTASFTVTNPGAEPYVIAPGYQDGEGEAWGFVDKVIINGQEVAGITQTRLYTGSRVKTGPGVEIVLRTAFGAVTRVKENSTYEVEVRKLATTATIDVVGRLKDGVGEFYWPKGHAGAEKFRVDTSRVVVGIKGTTFTVSQINDVSTVSVQEGVVQVTNLDTGVVTQVGAGSSLTAADEGGYVNGAYNYYVPYYSSINGNWTGLGLANDNSAANALVQVSVYDRSGRSLAIEKKLIAVGGQESLPVAGGENASGWMLVNAHQPLSGLAFIGFNGSKTLMADIPFVADLATNLVIPHVAQDGTWDTSILLCNPHNYKNKVYFELVDQSGFSQGIESFELPALGSGEYPLASLFASASRKNGKILITSDDGGVAAFALYSDVKNGGNYYAGINAVAEDPGFRFSAPTFSYYLPYFSTENGDWTGLALANPDMFGSVEPQITVYNETGTVQTEITVLIEIWGQNSLSLTPPTASWGWIKVDSDGP